MKKAISTFVILFFVVGLVGVAAAIQLTGKVTALDAGKGIITVEKKKIETSFDCEGSKLSKIKVGDKVTVKFKEEGGKKVVTSIKKKKKKAAIGC